MNTPICDFVDRYAKGNFLRLHMPGHKGASLLGFEHLDITEIQGADSLFAANGIIAESERNAGSLFGAHTFYSTEGSSLCIRAMLALVMQNTPERCKKPLILAGRNAHRSFLSAAALLDFDIEWLYPSKDEGYLSCTVDPNELDKHLEAAVQKPAAVYLTSPDYLGHLANVREISAVCHRHGVLLLVDNAHGAYLKFLPNSLHPIDLGADLCCDSAHKTLPALTGCAYLHVSPSHPALAEQAKDALALFASTSPSYLLLQSLDAVNGYLDSGYAQRISAFAKQASNRQKELIAAGYVFEGDEPLKWTIRCDKRGYCGNEFADLLEKNGIVCEFFDHEYCVLMLTPETETEGLERLCTALISIPARNALPSKRLSTTRPQRVFSPREATLAPAEELPLSECAGRVLARDAVTCPPAVAIVVCGERIDEQAAALMARYGTEKCKVILKKTAEK